VAQTSPKPASLKRRLILAAAGLLVGLLLAELSLRLWAPPGVGFVLDATTSSFDPGMFQEDPVLLQRLAPSTTTTVQSVQGSRTLRTNSLGLRGPELKEKPASEIRVLALGDSFTLGLQVAEAQTWSAQLSSRLGTALEVPVQVLNAGMVGYGTRQSTHRLVELAASTQADAAVLLFYLGNDLRDNLRYPLLKQALRQPPPTAPAAPPPETRHWLRGLARLSHLVAHGLAWAQTRDVSADFRLMEYRDEMTPFVQPATLQGQIGLTSSALRDFGRACKNAAIPCMLVLAPPSYAVHTDLVGPTFRAFGLDPAAVNLGAPAEAVSRAAPVGMPVLDLTASMRAVAAERRMYMVFDPHWSAEGHAVAAEIMAPPVAKMIAGRIK
jgi:hypothetical protein